METPDGKLPNLPPQAKVYFLTKRTSNIKTLERANQKARSLGYDPNGKEITETSYQYQHPNLPCTLEMNIVTELFSMSCDLRDEKLSISNVVLTPDAAIKQVKAFLSRAQLLPADMSGPAVHEFIKMSEGKLVGAISLSESEMIKVNLYRKDLETIPSVASRSDQSNLWFILSPLNTYGNVVIAGEYHYFPLDETRFDTYALKTASEAWEDLKTGKGYIANLGQNNEGVLKIRRIYLAYYDPDVYTQYYQPVVVFEGDNNFVAYVPVITSLYYGSDQLTPTEEP